MTQRTSCQDGTKLSPPPTPSTTAPLNRHLQNRGLSETDPDGPAATVTRGVCLMAQTPAGCVSHEGVASHISQVVSPTCSDDSHTRWEIPLPAQVPGKMETGPERRLQKQTQRQSVPCDYCALSPGCTLKSPGGALNIDARPQPGTISVDHQSAGTCCGRGGSRPVNCLHGPVRPQEFHFPTDKPAAQIESVQMSLCLQVPPHALPMCSYRRLSHGAMRAFPRLPGASSGGLVILALCPHMVAGQ